ncbi:unnamed protein product [Closterium sp. NIES-54]
MTGTDSRGANGEMAGATEAGEQGGVSGGGVGTHQPANPTLPTSSTPSPTTVDPVKAFSIEKFMGEDYEHWSFRMRLMYTQYKLLDLVEGKEKMPEAAELKGAWMKRSFDAYMLMVQAVGGRQLDHFKDLLGDPECGPKAWRKLLDVHSPTHATGIVLLARRLRDIKFVDGEPMQPVLDEMRDIFTKLKGGGVVYPELVQCMEIVIRLPESWSALAINLNSQQPQWSVDCIRARILEEDLRRRSVERSEEGAGYGVGGGKSGFKKNWKGKNKDYPKEDGGGGQGEVCFYCKKRGHRWRKCYQRPKDWTPPSSSNLHGGKRSGGVMGATGEEKDEEKGGKSEERKAGFFFVNEGATDLAMAAKVLLHPLTHWVIDSGSSWHMTLRAALPTEPRCPLSRAALPSRTALPSRIALHCPPASAAIAATAATLATAPTAAMASPTVLTFDAEGRAVDFDVWVDDLQLFLQCDSRDGVSLFDHTSSASTAPAATADSTVRSQWTTRDAVARLAVRSYLPPAERAHFGQYKTAQSLYDAVVARYSSPATAALSRLMLPYLFPDLATFAIVTDLVAHLRTSDARYRAALPTEFCAKNPPPMYIILYYLVTRLPDSLSSVLLATTVAPLSLREAVVAVVLVPAGARAAGGSTGAGAAGAAGPGGARTGGTGAAGAGGTAGVGAAGTEAGGAAVVVAGDPGAEGTGAVSVVSGGPARPRPYYVPLLQQVLGLPPSPGPPPPLLSPQPVQSESQLQPSSPLPGPSPYSGPTRGLTERREPESRPVSPVSRAVLPVRTTRAGRRVSCPLPPPVPGTHSMTMRPSTAPQRVSLPYPPASSLPDGPDPEFDSLRATSPTVPRFLSTADTDPLFESSAASALVAELVDFAAAYRLDFATSLVAEFESASVCPPSVGGECALGMDVLEFRQEEFECFAVAVPHLVSMVLAPKGDPDAPDIPTPRSYAKAIEV